MKGNPPSVDFEEVCQEAGFIPDDKIQQWIKSLNPQQKEALEKYTKQLWKDAETTELEAF